MAVHDRGVPDLDAPWMIENHHRRREGLEAPRPRLVGEQRGDSTLLEHVLRRILHPEPGDLPVRRARNILAVDLRAKTMTREKGERK